MAQNKDEGAGVHVSIGGSVSGNLNVAGGDATQTIKNSVLPDAEGLKAALKGFKEHVEKAAPEAKKKSALAFADELESQALSEEPDKSTLEMLGEWFKKNVPGVAASLATVMGHPIIGQVLKVMGHAVSEET